MASCALLWRSWSTLGTLLGPFWGVLRPSWDAFGPSWDTLGASWDALGPLVDVSWRVLEGSWETYRKKVEGDQAFGGIWGSKMEAKINKNPILKTLYFLIRFFRFRMDVLFFLLKVQTRKISISPRREHDFYKIDIFINVRNKC